MIELLFFVGGIVVVLGGAIGLSKLCDYCCPRYLRMLDTDPNAPVDV